METAGTVGAAVIMATGQYQHNKNVNVSGNEINMNRGGVFSQNSLQPTQRPAGWQARSAPPARTGLSEAVQQRLGRTQQPACGGQRLVQLRLFGYSEGICRSQTTTCCRNAARRAQAIQR